MCVCVSIYLPVGHVLLGMEGAKAVRQSHQNDLVHKMCIFVVLYLTKLCALLLTLRPFGCFLTYKVLLWQPRHWGARASEVREGRSAFSRTQMAVFENSAVSQACCMGGMIRRYDSKYVSEV